MIPSRTVRCTWNCLSSIDMFGSRRRGAGPVLSLRRARSASRSSSSRLRSSGSGCSRLFPVPAVPFLPSEPFPVSAPFSGLLSPVSFPGLSPEPDAVSGACSALPPSPFPAVRAAIASRCSVLTSALPPFPFPAVRAAFASWRSVLPSALPPFPFPAVRAAFASRRSVLPSALPPFPFPAGFAPFFSSSTLTLLPYPSSSIRRQLSGPPEAKSDPSRGVEFPYFERNSSKQRSSFFITSATVRPTYR